MKTFLKWYNLQNNTAFTIDDITENGAQYELKCVGIDGKEYLIGDGYGEVEAACKEYVKETVWAFNADFIADQCSSNDNSLHSFIVGGCAALQGLCESANAPILALIESQCGLDDFVREAIDADGEGHFLAGYDGIMLEFEGIYIFRV